MTTSERTKAPSRSALVRKPVLLSQGQNTPANGQRLTRIVTTEAVHYDPAIPADVKILVGLHAVYKNRPPRQREIEAAIPWFTRDRQTKATKWLRDSDLAWVNWRREDSRPITLTRLAPHVDTYRPGARLIHTPIAPLARLTSATPAARDAIYLGYLHNLQKQSGAVQSADVTSAAILGTSKTAVLYSRSRWLEIGVLQEVRPATRHTPAIYTIPDALPGAAARFDPDCPSPDCPNCFNERWAKSLHDFQIGDEKLTVLANQGQAATIDRAIVDAAPRTLTTLAELACDQHKPHPYIRATDLLYEFLDVAPNTVDQQLELPPLGADDIPI